MRVNVEFQKIIILTVKKISFPPCGLLGQCRIGLRVSISFQVAVLRLSLFRDSCRIRELVSMVVNI